MLQHIIPALGAACVSGGWVLYRLTFRPRFQFVYSLLMGAGSVVLFATYHGALWLLVEFSTGLLAGLILGVTARRIWRKLDWRYLVEPRLDPELKRSKPKYPHVSHGLVDKVLVALFGATLIGLVVLFYINPIG